MKKALYIFCLLVFSALLCAQKAPSAGSILKAVDKNMLSSTSKSTTRMVIHSKRSSMVSINYPAAATNTIQNTPHLPEKGHRDAWWAINSGSMSSPATAPSRSRNMLKQSVMARPLL